MSLDLPLISLSTTLSSSSFDTVSWMKSCWQILIMCLYSMSMWRNIYSGIIFIPRKFYYVIMFPYGINFM
jgi:hypothetical protein